MTYPTPRSVTPVYGFRDGAPETVAHFFDSWDAVDFVQDNLGTRNFYLAPSILALPVTIRSDGSSSVAA